MAYNQFPRALSSEQEISIMVEALTNVLSGATTGDYTITTTTPVSVHNLSTGPIPLESDLDTCRVCNILGCLGCNLFSKKYRGVRQKRPGKWSAEIWIPEKTTKKWLGTFNTPEEAARAYDQAAIDFNVARPKLNFPFPHETSSTANNYGNMEAESSSQQSHSTNSVSDGGAAEVDSEFWEDIKQWLEDFGGDSSDSFTTGELIKLN